MYEKLKRLFADTGSCRSRIQNCRADASAAWLIAFACLLVLARSAQAEGNIHLGQLRIHPSLQLSKAWSDNVFNSPLNTRRDTIAIFTPGVALEREFGKHRAEVKYNSTISRYDTYTAENTEYTRANGIVDLKLGSRFGLRFSDFYTRGYEERGYSATGSIEKFKNNVGTVSVTYQLADRSKVQFDAQKIDWNFNTSMFRDRDEAFYSGYLYYRFLPKTSAFIELDRRNVVFSDPALGLDNTVISGYMGLRWDATAKSKGVVKAGALSKDFKAPFHKDYGTWSTSIDLSHAFSEYTNFAFKGERIVHEATLPGTRFQVTTGAFLAFSHRFLRRLEILTRGTYGTSQFSDPIPPDTIRRRDKTWAAGGGLKYFFREWLNFGLDYNSRTRDSNIPENNFREHITMVSATMAL